MCNQSEPLSVQLAREMLQAIDNGDVRVLNGKQQLRPNLGDAKYIDSHEAQVIAQRCINQIIAAGFKPY